MCIRHYLTVIKSMTYLESRSSWLIPRWMAMVGKFCSTSSCDSAMHRCTDFTKITTWKGRNQNYSSSSVSKLTIITYTYI